MIVALVRVGADSAADYSGLNGPLFGRILIKRPGDPYTDP